VSTVGEVQGQAVGVLVDALDAGVGADGGARADARAGQRQGVGHGIGDRLAGDDQRTVLGPHVDGHAVATGVLGEACDGGPLGVRAGCELGAAVQHRDAECVQDGVAQARGVQDQRGLQLAWLGVEARVQDAGVGAARAVGEAGVGLEEGGGNAAVGEGEQHGGTDDATADDGNRGVGHDFSSAVDGSGQAVSAAAFQRARNSAARSADQRGP
jgi:hypothetical protein